MRIVNHRIGTMVTALVLFAATEKLLLAQTESSAPESSASLIQTRFEQISGTFSVAPEKDARALIELVVDNHWMPPVRQEMIWKGILFAYQFSGLVPLASTAEEIPCSADPKELSAFLRAQKKRWLGDPGLVKRQRISGSKSFLQLASWNPSLAEPNFSSPNRPK